MTLLDDIGVERWIPRTVLPGAKSIIKNYHYKVTNNNKILFFISVSGAMQSEVEKFLNIVAKACQFHIQECKADDVGESCVKIADLTQLLSTAKSKRDFYITLMGAKRRAV